MGRNDIRLRRKSITSRRIERHKNYEEIMRRHKRSSMMNIFRWVVIGLLFLAGLYALGLYYL